MTVILGLGSNLGDRLDNLRRGLTAIRAIAQTAVEQISPVYVSDALLPDNAPPDWHRPYLNCAVRINTHLTPRALLAELKLAEKKAGRLPEKVWGPRIIDIDLLAFDQQIIDETDLTLPHPHLIQRPFVLWPLADLAADWQHPIYQKTAAELITAWGSRFNGCAPFHTRQIAQRIDTPEWVGIINLTPNSFSDGGRLTYPAAALSYARQLVEAGASILDIGAEATNVDVEGIDPEQEWQRLDAFLPRLLAERKNFVIPPRISLDTRHARVAARALALGIDWVNDVSGLNDPAMVECIAASACDIVCMHHVSVPARLDVTLPAHVDALTAVLQWGENKLAALTAAGINAERIILDPGIGFGKTPSQSLALIKNIAAFKALGTRILVGHSRKGFLRQFTAAKPAERDIETAALSLHMAAAGVDYIRVHNVDIHARLLRASASV